MKKRKTRSFSVVDSKKLPKNTPFTPELATHRKIERRPTNRAGEYGFRIRLLSDDTGDARLVIAAERYVDDAHLAGGARDRDLSGVRAGGSCDGYTVAQLDAQGRVREAETAIRPVYAQILRDALLDCVTASELGRRWRISHVTATVWARQAFEALADHYDVVDRVGFKKIDLPRLQPIG